MDYCEHEERVAVRYYMVDTRLMIRMECKRCWHLSNAVKQDEYNIEELPLAMCQEEKEELQLSLF